MTTEPRDLLLPVLEPWSWRHPAQGSGGGTAKPRVLREVAGGIGWSPKHRLPWWLRCRESACIVGDPGLIPESGRSPREGSVSPLQYSCLENSTDRGAWRATVHGVARSQTGLRETNIFTFTFTAQVLLLALEVWSTLPTTVSPRPTLPLHPTAWELIWGEVDPHTQVHQVNEGQSCSCSKSNH